MNRLTSVILVLGSAIVVICGCGPSQLAGTEVGNPTLVFGKVADQDQAPLRNAAVFLVTPGYNPALDTISLDNFPFDTTRQAARIFPDNEQRLAVRTDGSGKFTIRSLQRRAYNLYVADSGMKRQAFRSRISLGDTSVDLGVINVTPPLYASVRVADSVYADAGYIVLPGTPVKVAVDKAGQYSVPLHFDTLTVIYVSDEGDSLSTIIDKRAVSDQPRFGDTIDLTGIELELVPPAVAAISGSDTISFLDTLYIAQDTSVTVAAIGASSNKEHVLEYRFVEINRGSSSSWSTSPVYDLPVNGVGTYAVSCLVRSRTKPEMTATSPVPFVFIAAEKSTPVNMTTPRIPFADDSVVMFDTLPHSFITGGSEASDGSGVEYRLRWMEISESDSTYTAWQSTELFSIMFPNSGGYLIAAQARSADDSTRVSAWSESFYYYLRLR